MKEIICDVINIEQIMAHIYRVRLRAPLGEHPAFFAGQYLSINLPSRDTPLFFSIASRPGLENIDLHIQADPYIESAVEVIKHLKKDAKASISLPFGKACLSEMPDKPIILLAAGTGFAQMKSIVEHLYFHSYSRPISFYWGVRKQSDMYMQSLAETWGKQYERFSFTPLIANVEDNQSVEHHSRMASAVVADNPDLGGSMVFVSGSPMLVCSAMDAFLALGLPKTQFFSDALEELY